MSDTVQRPQKRQATRITVNGVAHGYEVEPRLLLVHFLRDVLNLTGTHVGCDTGQCGACTVLMNGQAVKSCMVLSMQADGASITTVEGLAQDGQYHPMQQAFWERHGLQCGFCTPGMMLAAICLLRDNPNPTDDQIREQLEGNLCRCTGYQNIVAAVRAAAEAMRSGQTEME
jgi:carbon-monoxide dehydrogenase small subunit